MDNTVKGKGSVVVTDWGTNWMYKAIKATASTSDDVIATSATMVILNAKNKAYLLGEDYELEGQSRHI